MRVNKDKIVQFVKGFDSLLSIILLSVLIMIPVWSLCATGLLLFDALNWPMILIVATPLSLLCIIFVTWLHSRYREVICPDEFRLERLICTVATIVFLSVWSAFNMLYPSEHVLVDRDPGIYTLGALHLVENDSLDISSENELGGSSFVTSQAVGVSRIDDKEMYFQGTHLLSALVGLGGRVLGIENVFKLNVVFGAMALLAIFMFAQRILRPFWALFSMLIMSVSMPMLYFSRDMYTEPLAATFVFAGLLLMWLSVQTRNRLLWLAAGLAVGASTLTRIDGYLAIVAALVFVACYVAFGKKRQRRGRMLESGFLALGMLITGLFGWLDLFVLSSGYFFDLYHNFMLQIGAIVAVVISAVVLCRVHWRTDLFSRVNKVIGKKYPLIISMISLLVVVLLLTRQFWNQTYTSSGVRNFNELTGLWPGWYFGDVIICLGVVGVVILLHQTLAKKKIIYLIPLTMVLLTCALYLIRPSISPDQVWASRRLLPVVLPGIVIFSMVTVQALIKIFNSKYVKTGTIADPLKQTVLKSLFAIGVGVALLVPPLSISRPMLMHSQYTQLSTLREFCMRLPKNSLVVWIGKGSGWATQSTETVCKHTSVGLSDENINNENIATIAGNARASNLVPVVAVLGRDLYPSAEQLATGDYLNVISDSDKQKFQLGAKGAYSRFELSIYGAPREMLQANLDMYYIELKLNTPLVSNK